MKTRTQRLIWVGGLVAVALCLVATVFLPGCRPDGNGPEALSIRGYTNSAGWHVMVTLTNVSDRTLEFTAHSTPEDVQVGQPGPLIAESIDISTLPHSLKWERLPPGAEPPYLQSPRFMTRYNPHGISTSLVADGVAQFALPVYATDETRLVVLELRSESKLNKQINVIKTWLNRSQRLMRLPVKEGPFEIYTTVLKEE